MPSNDHPVSEHEFQILLSDNTQTCSPDQSRHSPRNFWCSPLFGYASSLVCVLVAILLNWLEMVVDIHDYFIGMLFVIGTFLIAWMWGTGPALLALVVGTLCTDYLSIPPLHSFSLHLWPTLVSLLPYLVIQVLFIWLIARQKRFQAHLLRAQHDITRFAGRLAESNTRLTQADRVKDQFLSVASHELRTPVTSMHGYVQLLLRRIKHQSVQTPELLPIHEALLKVDAQNRRLMDLLTDLLDINRLRSGALPLQLTPLDLRDLCRTVVEEQQSGTDRVIDLHLPSHPVIVHADEKRLGQVLLNLVTNALKYSPEGTPIRVEGSQHSHEAILAVHNEGPVLSQEQQQRIFEPFYRSPQTQASATPGWGLGLAISKELGEQHGGRLWVESTEETGTTFFVALPLSPCTETIGSHQRDQQKPSPE